ncbi:MAG: D-alanine--D-alanine ligase [Chitinophagaceae bacterium]|nr:D-alanine--D-alanine ligase [Chitinophagaceae bacterium]
MNSIQRILHRPFFIKLFNWEYWSFGVVYALLYPVWILLCLRARSFFFFSASNPSIENGGFLNESKKDIHKIIPAHLSPKTVFFSLPANTDRVIEQLNGQGMRFPLIGKPDIGGRGRGVKALKDEYDVRSYVQNAFLDFHIQEFVAFKNEVGIFYYRYPNKTTGSISGIVEKKFLSVTGNGKNTIRELLKNEKRAILQMDSLETMYGNELNEILETGEKKTLVPYGNHARGAKFLDVSEMIDEELTATIDAVCMQVKDFYFGRLDIRYHTWEELKKGKNFSVIEVNGAGSEPTHIYDPKHSLFFAWKEIIRHWIILWRISRMNHKRGYHYLNFKDGVRMFREDKLNSRKLAAMPE